MFIATPFNVHYGRRRSGDPVHEREQQCSAGQAGTKRIFERQDLEIKRKREEEKQKQPAEVKKQKAKELRVMKCPK